MEKVLLDTNILLDDNFNINDFNNIYIPNQVLEELDGLKKADGYLGYKARKAIKVLEEKRDITYIIQDSYDMPIGWDDSKRDNQIIMCAKENKCKLISNDINVRVKAKSIELDNDNYRQDTKNEFKGYRIIEIDTTNEKDNEFLSEIYSNDTKKLSYLYPNEYLIIRDTSIPVFDEYDEKIGCKTIDILKWNGEKFIALKLPPKKIVKPLNDLQKCTLDLLMSDTPIKIISGCYGSGKSMITTQVGHYLVREKGDYDKLIFIRNNDIIGKDPGALPGDIQDKTDVLFQSLIQHLPMQDYEYRVAKDKEAKDGGWIETYITYFIKGLSLSGFLICDEAEDLTLTDIKKIGSRLERGCICFLGDWKQAEGKYKNNNGLLELLNKTKNDERVGSIVMDLDVRSDASKLFAEL